MLTYRLLATGVFAAALATTAAIPSQAALTLTAAGVAQGLSLSTFVDGLPSAGSGVGPIAVAFPTGGNVLVTDWASGKIVAFSSDADGQHYSGGTPSTSGYDRPTGMATSGGTVYMAEQGGGRLVQVDANGDYVSTIASGLSTATGLAISNGFAYVSNVDNAIYKIDLTAHTVSTLVPGVAVDGITLSPDGTVIYGEAGFHIYGWNTTTGASTGYDSGSIYGADGAAAAVGALAGDIFVNTNYGELWEIDSLGHQTLIADGGSRGDLVTIDPTNGSLLLSQTDSILRLTLPSGSSFSDDVPEPASIAVLSVGLLGLGGLRRRRR